MNAPGWYPPILAYHRIYPEPRTDTPVIHPSIFEKQMELLARRWKPLSLHDFVICLENGTSIPNRAVVVTFDDGTDDTFTHAFPILQRYKIPATVFLIASHLGKPGALYKDQIDQMSQAGITLGSHTLHHAYLPSLSEEKILQELSASKKVLENLGRPVEFLSYPGGGFSPAIAAKVRETGYRAACTTNRGTHRFPINRWALRRITMHEKAMSPLGIFFRCCGYYGINRRLRSPC